jgi:flagellar hook-length control protein FliK
VFALATAVATLGGGTATSPTPVATDPTAAAVANLGANAANAPVTNSGSATDPIATEAPAPLNPAVTAFLKTFADALVSTNASAGVKTDGHTDSDPGALLQTTVSSAQAPTIGVFAPVQAAVQNDAASTRGSSDSQPLPSQATVDPNAVVDQILRGAFLNTVGSTSTVRLSLVPQELGDVNVKLTVDGNSVSAQVIAQTPAAHDALVAGQAQLTRSLADAGLKLTSFNVDLAGGFASFQQQQQQQSSQQGNPNGRPLFLGGVDTTETDDASLTAAPNFGPPVLAGASWSALNYLV